MPRFRGVIVDGESTTVFVVPLGRAPDPGEIVELENGKRVAVEHVLSAGREEAVDGIIVAAPAP